MANFSQARSNILSKKVLSVCFLYEHIETQNLGKDLACLACSLYSRAGYNGVCKAIKCFSYAINDGLAGVAK